MKYQGKIQDPLDLVTKQYVDNRSGVKSVNGDTGDVTVTYQSLSDKPTIPSALSELSADSTHRTVTDEEKSTWNGKGTYSKPSGGIPKTDLDSVVQASLVKADSALQSAPVNSVNNKTGVVNLTASDVGADSAGTAAGLINNLDFTSPSASGNDISFIGTVSQSDGKISATKKTVRSASTSQTGVVRLNNTVTSTSTTQAATANAVKQAYDNGGVQSVNGHTGAVTVDAGSSYHLYTGVLDADNWTELADGHFQQSITISGVLGSDMPILDVDITAGEADVDTQMNREDEWTAFRGWTENNLLTVILSTLPPIDIPIKLLCFRQ